MMDDDYELDSVPEEDDQEYDEAPMVCLGCGCSEDNPCEGGCVWATPDLCSRCV